MGEGLEFQRGGRGFQHALGGTQFLAQGLAESVQGYSSAEFSFFNHLQKSVTETHLGHHSPFDDVTLSHSQLSSVLVVVAKMSPFHMILGPHHPVVV